MRRPEEKQSQGIGNGQPGPGRKKGVPNKLTADVRAMILGALNDAGGQAYLATQAVAQPASFLALVGKTLPREVKMDLAVSIAERLRRAEDRVASD